MKPTSPSADRQPTPDDIAYYASELARLRRVAALRRALGIPDTFLEAGIAVLDGRLRGIKGEQQ
jgi:hypothetical protein